jgi:dolichol-phosphate mannosyltransferase
MRGSSPGGKSIDRAPERPPGASETAKRLSAGTRPDRLTVRPDLSVVVPCRNERDNVGPLLRSIRADLIGRAVEVVFVDDSDDGTAGAIEEEAARSAYPIVRLIHRPPGERAGGLGSAVVAGAAVADGQFVAVMDADLQHPPSVLAAMVDCAALTSVDLVVGSRYVRGGRACGLSRGRAMGSWAAGWLARTLFPRRLGGVSDPMSGFFVFRAGAVDLAALAPDGFKILLEVLVRVPHLSVVEIPYTFGSRHAGASKASVREARRYLRALLRLRFERTTSPPPPPLEMAPTEAVSA